MTNRCAFLLYTDRMKTPCFASIVLCLTPFLLSACSGSKPDAPGPDALGTVVEVMAPAPQSSGQANLSVGADGKTYLSWIESLDTGSSALKFAVRTPQGWSEPQKVIESFNMMVNWADFPSLFELSDGVLAAHWLAALPDSDEGYNVNLALSQDQGKTWSKPITPHRDAKKGEHGFVSLAPAPGNQGISVIWLDPRKLEDEEGDVALMQTTVAADGTLGNESEIDPRVCECCQPTTVTVPDGLLTAYRDRSQEEIRDIVVARFEGGKWSTPKTVFDDHWEIQACPIQGPALSASGNNVVVAWFTEANDMPKVQVAFSTDGGKSFGAPVQVDDGNPIGRVDVAILESGGAVVTWIEHAAAGGELRARQIEAGGTRHDARTIASTSIGTESGFPRVRRTGDGILFAWTDTGEHRVRTALATAAK